MNTMLIVDDEQMVVDYIRASVDWDALGVTSVRCAYSMGEAQRLIETEPPDVMLCDIEMPDGSGLQLMRWAADEGYRFITIILTGHARFEYAQSAVSLGCFGYLLKPIERRELEGTLRKAIERLSEERRERFGGPADSEERQAQRCKEYWQELLHPKLRLTGEQVARLAEQKGLPAPTGLFLLELLRVDLSLTERADWDAMETVRLRVDGELPTPVCEPLLLENELALLFATSAGTAEALRARSDRWIQRVKRECGEEVSALIGDACPAETLYKQYDMLTYLARHSVLTCRAALMGECDMRSVAYAAPDGALWRRLLSARAYDALRDEIDKYLNERMEKGELNVYGLGRFYQELLQMLCADLERQGLSAEALTDGERLAALAASAPRSLSAMRLWASGVLERLRGLESEPARRVPAPGSDARDDDAIMDAKRYIRAHLYENLSRAEIAEHVSLSPEHLSRLFHKREGVTLQRYIQGKKAEEAKKLLRETELPVGEIAQRLGFDNFAYFSQYFKKSTGYLPLQYRAHAQHRK